MSAQAYFQGLDVHQGSKIIQNYNANTGDAFCALGKNGVSIAYLTW